MNSGVGQTILVIEDEPSIADNITYALKTEGYLADWVTTGAEAEIKLLESSPSLIILDVGLPDVNGFDLAREIRKTFDVPIIFVTARSDEIDRIVGLELGADDYIVKPFSPRELTARVRAVLRRTEGQADRESTVGDKILEYGPFKLDEERHKISFFGETLDLSRYEFRILAVLLKRPGKVFSRDELMNRAWEEPDMSLERTVDSHVKTIRQKLRSANSEDEAIITHRGIGYALKEYASISS